MTNEMLPDWALRLRGAALGTLDSLAWLVAICLAAFAGVSASSGSVAPPPEDFTADVSSESSDEDKAGPEGSASSGSGSSSDRSGSSRRTIPPGLARRTLGRPCR